MSVWFFVGNGGMDYGDHYCGLYRDYYTDPFPHSLLRTRQVSERLSSGLEFGVRGFHGLDLLP